MKYFILLLLLVGCAKSQSGNPDIGIDPTFTPYVQKYETLKGSQIKSYITINFAELPDNKYGLAWTNGRIQIDTKFWRVLSEENRLALVSHELGHADLGRDHFNDRDENNIPLSIMSERAFDLDPAREEYYFNELFGR